MNEELTNTFINKALQNIKAAEVCFENALYDASTNRAYYAAFQAAVAVLAKAGISDPKNEHKWVLSNFSAELINRRKWFSQAISGDLSFLIYNRNIADYKNKHISKSVAKKQLTVSKLFVETIKRKIS